VAFGGRTGRSAGLIEANKLAVSTCRHSPFLVVGRSGGFGPARRNAELSGPPEGAASDPRADVVKFLSTACVLADPLKPQPHLVKRADSLPALDAH
jgi:hypothetical protein